MSLNGGLIHQHLRDYKDSFDPKDRLWKTRRLAALTAVFLHNNHHCLGEWDYLVPVPSIARCAPQAIVSQVKVLKSAPQPDVTFDANGKMAITEPLSGSRVLVFDDTFTTGASVWNATRAIRDAGGAVVGPLVIGRHITPRWDPTDSMLEWLTDRTWDQNLCCRCGGQMRTPGTLPL